MTYYDEHITTEQEAEMLIEAMDGLEAGTAQKTIADHLVETHGIFGFTADRIVLVAKNLLEDRKEHSYDREREGYVIDRRR